jgi:cyclopropane fatty-acyl-phospholipid synthase-like methyltransferase
MSQVTSGLRVILGNPLVYSFFQTLVGATRSRRRVIQDHLRLRPGDFVLEVGCGPGEFFEYFPDGINFTGFDLSQSYIDFARRKYAHRRNGQFHCADVSEFALADPGRFDVCFAAGVLHHLSDEECSKLFNTAQHALKTGGRFVSIDPVFVDGQSKIAKYIISKDRGQNVRPEAGYRNLANSVFNNVTVSVRHDLLRIPYSHIIMEGIK